MPEWWETLENAPSAPQARVQNPVASAMSNFGQPPRMTPTQEHTAAIGDANLDISKERLRLDQQAAAQRAALVAAQTSAVEATTTTNRQKLAAAQAAKRKAAADAKRTADEIQKIGDEALASPGLRRVVGSGWSPLHGVWGQNVELLEGTESVNPRIWPRGTDADEFLARHKALEAKLFPAAAQLLKGSGPVANYERQAAARSLAQLSLAQPPEEYIKNVRRLQENARLDAQRFAMQAMSVEELQAEMARRSERKAK
jgi:hypothetical protein